MPDETPIPRQRSTRRSILKTDRSGGANQADAAGTDINKIVAQHKAHGTLPAVQQRNPLYGDFTFPEDIHSMREAVDQAEDRFMQLPAAVRTAAGNDWVNFETLFRDPEQRELLINAGLIIAPTDPTPPQPTSDNLTTTKISTPAQADPGLTGAEDGAE